MKTDERRLVLKIFAIVESFSQIVYNGSCRRALTGKAYILDRQLSKCTKAFSTCAVIFQSFCRRQLPPEKQAIYRR